MAAPPAPFSRLQLAAALLEYDNDPTNPDAPNRSAHESAIFAHLRRNNGGRDMRRRSADYLGVSLPSENGSLGRESVLGGQRKSQGSINNLRNPFGPGEEEESQDEQNLEVDLTSWGLDALIPKEKGKDKGKGRVKADAFPNPHTISTVPPPRSVPGGRTPRSSSVGALSDFGVGGAFLEAQTGDIQRRSVGCALDAVGIQQPQRPVQRRRASSHALIETLPVTLPLHSIPFPTTSVRSASPGAEDALRPASRASRFDFNEKTHARNQSDASFGSRVLLNDEDGNPFAVRPPSPDRASRFDPKVRARTMSSGTMASMNILADENAFAVRPPSPSRSSRFDPKTRGRTMSVATMGTQMMLDNDNDAESLRQPRDRPYYSTLELLRPKILVMPSPLQPVTSDGPTPPSPQPQQRDGFLVSTDGPPLPPGARPIRRASSTLSAFGTAPTPVASNAFTPNPRASLSLSQLAFRNTLMVGGQRDITYTDIDNALPRATEEGEQAQFAPPPVEEKPESNAALSTMYPSAPPPTEAEIQARPAGKLYGRSLIDNLEQRKANMRQKQRVFTGDDRPSMMARGQIRRSNTLIDPASLQRPISQNIDANVPRNGSTKPLLDFNAGGGRPTTVAGGLNASPSDISPGMATSRSVFGVDTLWESEMFKLREIEAQEKLDEEEERRKREYDEAAQNKKRKGKSKGKNRAPEIEAGPEPLQPDVRVSTAPPTLPAIRKPILKRPPPAVDDDEESESDSDEDRVARGGAHHSEAAVDGWVAGSSDEEDNGPRRIPGVGPRYPNSQRPTIALVSHKNDEDSEEDLPLAAAMERAAKRVTHLPSHGETSDEDEDKPLSTVLNKAKLNLSFDKLSVGNEDDEDDKPLGLRASRIPFVSQSSIPLGADDDDDKPLAFHPEQQRRTQYQMFAQAQAQAQAQQQQQQFMMQAQLQNSMFFANPAMMGSTFFSPPIPPPPMMVVPPMPMPSPPPDNVKFGRVDRWRHDVAVEGSEG